MKELQFHDIYFLDQKKKCANTVVQKNGENGSGEMLRYDVAPGIQITYNNLNMDSCYSPIIPEQDFLQIDHCLEGGYECELAGGIVSFLGEGDLSVSSLCKGQQLFIGSRINVNNLTQATTTYSVSFNWHGIPCAFLYL